MMKRLTRHCEAASRPWQSSLASLFSYLLLSLTPIHAFANTPSPQTQPTSIPAAIDKVLKGFDQNVNIGILVQDANTGKVLFSKNADRFYMPASNQKLITAFAALNYLSPQFSYQTNLFVDVSKIQAGTLQDNLYLQFTGDPTLTMTQLDHLIASLMTAGVTHINGNIIIDDSMFDQMTMSPGTTWDDKYYCWGAPIGAIMVDGNCAGVTFTPAQQPGHAANMILPNYTQSLQFNNKVTTSAATDVCRLEVERTNVNTYTVSGCIRMGDTGREIKMAVEDPRTNLQSLLSYLLNKYQITTTGSIEFKKIDAPPKRLASESSQPLATLVKKMLKESDNMIANALFKTIGAAYTHDMGSYKNGSDAVRDILQKTIQLDISKNTLIDGAGASRYNFLSPQQIAVILQKNYFLPRAALFSGSLPVGGVDGTLRNRLKDPTTLGKVFAKTGTETAVTTLSGYLQTRSKQTLIFSIMINGFIDMPTRYEMLEDDICKALIET